MREDCGCAGGERVRGVEVECFVKKAAAESAAALKWGLFETKKYIE